MHRRAGAFWHEIAQAAQQRGHRCRIGDCAARDLGHVDEVDVAHLGDRRRGRERDQADSGGCKREGPLDVEHGLDPGAVGGGRVDGGVSVDAVEQTT